MHRKFFLIHENVCSRKYRSIAVLLSVLLAALNAVMGMEMNVSYAASSKKTEKIDRTVQIYTQHADSGSKTLAYQCRVSELAGMVEKNKKGYIYQYYDKNDSDAEYAVITTDTVPFEMLFKKAGLSKYWFSGSYLVITTENGTNRNMMPSYDEMLSDGYYFDEDGSHSVPSGLAVSWREGDITAGTNAVKALVLNAPAHELPRLVYGINEYQYNSRTAASDRLVDNVLSITIVYPDEPQQAVYTDDNPPDSALTVSIQNGDAGERIPVRSYTAAELRSMAEKNESGYVYEYYSEKILNAVVATEVAYFDNIVDDAGVNSYWTEGSKLEFITNTGRYTKYYPTYEDIKNNTSYIGMNAANKVPCGFALTWDHGQLTGNTGAAAELAASAVTTGNLCFVYGIDYSQYRNQTASANRMPTGVTEVTIIYYNKDIDRIFIDVSDDDWFSRYVTYVYYNGLMNGTEETEFEPYENVTRGQFISVLFRAAGGVPVNGINIFTDVPDDMYYRDPIVWGTETGIINGVSDSEFDPDRLLSREQIAVFLYRYAAGAGKDVLSDAADLSVYSDADEVSEYAYDAVSWAAGSGLLNVQSPDSAVLSPQEPMRRADLAATFSIFYERFMR